jgi:hypothetical protein
MDNKTKNMIIGLVVILVGGFIVIKSLPFLLRVAQNVTYLAILLAVLLIIIYYGMKFIKKTKS